MERLLVDVLPQSSQLIVTRAFNHTGPGQREDFVLPSLAAQIARIETRRQDARILVGNLDVQRDFLDVRDVVNAYVALIEAAPRLPNRFTVNVASGTPRLLRDALEKLRQQSATPFKIVVDLHRLRPVDVPLAFGRPALLQATTGWSPCHTFEETLNDLLTEARRLVHPAAI